jgi:hypothetical protein
VEKQHSCQQPLAVPTAILLGISVELILLSNIFVLNTSHLTADHSQLWWTSVGTSVPDPNPDPDPLDSHFLGLPDLDPLVKVMDPDPDLSLSKKKNKKTLIPTFL